MQYPTNNGRAYPVNSSVRGRQRRFTVAGKTEIGEIFCVCAQKDMVTNNVKRKQHGMLLIVLSGSMQNVLSCSLLAVSRKLYCNSYTAYGVHQNVARSQTKMRMWFTVFNAYITGVGNLFS